MPNPTFFRQPPFRVLVVGDVMVDRYIRGTVQRISPEAPVPVVRLRDADDRLGGAANVALNLRNLGAEVILCSVIGDDDSGQGFITAARREDLNMDSMVRDPGRRTTIKTRVIAGNQHLLRIDEEDLFPLSVSVREQIMEQVDQILVGSPPDVVLLQDYDKGVLDAQTIPWIIEACRAKGIPVAVDPKFDHFLDYKGVTLFKPNLKELGEGLGRNVLPNGDDLMQACKELHGQLGHRLSLVTLSDKGVFWFDHATELYGLVPPMPRDIVDVCGAGDTVISVAALALAAGWSPESIALLANLAGGQVCERVGVVPVSLDRLMEEFSSCT